MVFKLSLTSWSLPACSLQEAAGISKALAAQMMEPFATNAPAHAQI